MTFPDPSIDIQMDDLWMEEVLHFKDYTGTMSVTNVSARSGSPKSQIVSKPVPGFRQRARHSSILNESQSEHHPVRGLWGDYSKEHHHGWWGGWGTIATPLLDDEAAGVLSPPRNAMYTSLEWRWWLTHCWIPCLPFATLGPLHFDLWLSWYPCFVCILYRFTSSENLQIHDFIYTGPLPMCPQNKTSSSCGACITSWMLFVVCLDWMESSSPI